MPTDHQYISTLEAHTEQLQQKLANCEGELHFQNQWRMTRLTYTYALQFTSYVESKLQNLEYTVRLNRDEFKEHLRTINECKGKEFSDFGKLIKATSPNPVYSHKDFKYPFKNITFNYYIYGSLNRIIKSPIGTHIVTMVECFSNADGKMETVMKKTPFNRGWALKD
jgi:hypothetical protein